jgi:hypothetical protein
LGGNLAHTLHAADQELPSFLSIPIRSPKTSRVEPRVEPRFEEQMEANVAPVMAPSEAAQHHTQAEAKAAPRTPRAPRVAAPRPHQNPDGPINDPSNAVQTEATVTRPRRRSATIVPTDDL